MARKSTIHPDRKFLLGVIDEYARQEGSPDEKLLKRFLECEKEKIASQAVALLAPMYRARGTPIETPTDLLPLLL